MLSAILDVAGGKLTQKAVKGMLAGTETRPGGIKPLAPEYLVLMDVEYDFDFENVKMKSEYFEALATDMKLRSEVAAEIVKTF
jgi:tRNA U38,U39,U40 pseudouridine synthase TruA